MKLDNLNEKGIALLIVITLMIANLLCNLVRAL